LAIKLYKTLLIMHLRLLMQSALIRMFPLIAVHIVDDDALLII